MHGAWKSLAGTLEQAREWLLLDVNRLVLAAALLVVVYVILSLPQISGVLVGWSSPAAATLFGAFVTGNLTLITVVLSINQLVLSRELRTPQEMRTEIDVAIEYRDAVARQTGSRVTPEDLTHFLHLLLAGLRDDVDAFEAATRDVEQIGARRNAQALATALGSKVDDMDSLLTEPDVSLFTALSTILQHDLAAEFNRTWWLAHAEAAAYDEQALSALGAIQSHVRNLETARQYVKTLYVQYELATVSRRLLYVGVVTILAGVLGLTTSSVPAGVPESVALRAVITIGLAPLILLMMYVLRIATVAQRTAAFVPFGTPE